MIERGKKNDNINRVIILNLNQWENSNLVIHKTGLVWKKKEKPIKGLNYTINWFSYFEFLIHLFYKKNINFMKSVPFLLCLLIFISCSKDQTILNQNSDELQVVGDALSIEQLKSIDSMESFRIHRSKILLPNGRTVEEFTTELDTTWIKLFGDDPYSGLSSFDSKNMIISVFSEFGNILTNRSLFQYPAESNDAPAQNGLGYAYGSKNHLNRYIPHSASVCKNKIYGLDCSGLVYQIFKKAKLTKYPAGSAADQRKSTSIDNALAEYASLKNLHGENLGKLSSDKFESGDIIYWSKAGGTSASHIGIILKQIDGKLALFMAAGSPNNSCSENLKLTRGPVSIDFSKASSYWLKSSDANWEVIRIQAKKNSGEVISCSNLSFGCGPGGAGPDIYPRKFTFSACNGNPPYKYKLGASQWQESPQFTVFAPGSYLLIARDAQGCQISKLMKL
mgnify:CR=1 FL=1